MKRLVHAVIPVALRRWVRLRLGWQWFHGNYATWRDAVEASSGYDQRAILERVRRAAREVRAGHARWDRDGSLFHQEAVNRPLLNALCAARPEGGRLEVVDFGGGLGSVWWQHRAQLGDVRWRVVEQPHYVAAGREFADGTLSFHSSLVDTLRLGPVHVILFSSVLQYLPEPESVLAEAIAAGAAHLVVDRTGLAVDGRQRLTVQRTPPSLGGGSYPCWLFDRKRLIAPLLNDYELCSEWPAMDDVAFDVAYAGFHFKRKRP